MSRYIYNDQIAEISANSSPPSARSLFDIPIPENAKMLLDNFGLPDRFIEFRIDYLRMGLLRLDEYVEWWRDIERTAFRNTCHRLGREPAMYRKFIAPNPVDLSCYYRIGESDIGNTLSIERDSGNIYLIDIEGFQNYSPPGFINSNVMLLSQFMNLVSNATDGDRATLRSELTALDPNAMDDPDQGFWSTLVEEFESGIW